MEGRGGVGEGTRKWGNGKLSLVGCLRGAYGGMWNSGIRDAVNAPRCVGDPGRTHAPDSPRVRLVVPSWDQKRHSRDGNRFPGARIPDRLSPEFRFAKGITRGRPRPGVREGKKAGRPKPSRNPGLSLRPEFGQFPRHLFSFRMPPCLGGP